MADSDGAETLVRPSSSKRWPRRTFPSYHDAAAALHSGTFMEPVMVFRAPRSSFLRLIALAVLLPAPLLGQVESVEVLGRSEVAGGQPFGEVGSYERIVGRVNFAFDPSLPSNQVITDLSLAPTDPDGRVRATASFIVLQPIDPERRSGLAWVDIPNQGTGTSLHLVQRAPAGASPLEAAAVGDGLLLRTGATLVWVGWQQALDDSGPLLSLTGPDLGLRGEGVHGWVRAVWTEPEEPRQTSEDVATPAGAPVTPAPGGDVRSLALLRHRPYSVAEGESDIHRLWMRPSPDAELEEVPSEEWDFIEDESLPASLAGGPNAVRLEGGFTPGAAYELVYRARTPLVTGLGLAAVRDFVSHAKWDLESPFPVQKAVAFGAGQGGRFLRAFLHDGFNEDSRGDIVFEGVFIHGAGAGRGGFNHRFAQPSRESRRGVDPGFPIDLPPFGMAGTFLQGDGASPGLVDRTPEAARPLTMTTHTSGDYWDRGASLTHTSPSGLGDVDPLPSERMYYLVGRQPPRSWQAQEGGLGLDALGIGPTVRALAMRLLTWVETGDEPPPSTVPRVSDGTLVPAGAVHPPASGGAEAPGTPFQVVAFDFGKRWEEGIVDKVPPEAGAAFPVLVPFVDGFGNPLGGVRPIGLRVPLGTLPSWTTEPSPELLRVPQEGETGGSQPVRENLYPDAEAYLARARSAARRLVMDGFLLAEDLPHVLVAARALWEGPSDSVR